MNTLHLQKRAALLCQASNTCVKYCTKPVSLQSNVAKYKYLFSQMEWNDYLHLCLYLYAG